MAEVDGLDAIAASLKDQLETTLDEDERLAVLEQLARTLDQRFASSGLWDDREAAVNYTYEYLAYLELDDPRRSECIFALAGMLYQLYNGADRVSVEDAIDIGEQAYTLVLTGHVQSPRTIWTLAMLHPAKYQKEDCSGSLRRMIELMEQGFEYFHSLAAYSGLVVSLNITKHSSVAFLVYQNRIQALRFDIDRVDSLGYESVKRHVDLVIGPNSILKERDGVLDYKLRNAQMRKLLAWLWTAAVKPIFK
ncbi:hypothetical protein LTS12_028214, partial [Elasticomyces elasticus]